MTDQTPAEAPLREGLPEFAHELAEVAVSVSLHDADPSEKERQHEKAVIANKILPFLQSRFTKLCKVEQATEHEAALQAERTRVLEFCASYFGGVTVQDIEDAMKTERPFTSPVSAKGVENG